MNEEEMWSAVRHYYERAYKIKFKGKPDKKAIEDLYQKMMKVQRELGDFYFREPKMRENLDSFQGRKVPNEKTKNPQA